LAYARNNEFAHSACLMVCMLAVVSADES